MYPDDFHIPECGGLKIIVHGPDCKDRFDQTPYKLEGFDDTYCCDTLKELKQAINNELDRWAKKNLPESMV